MSRVPVPGLWCCEQRDMSKQSNPSDYEARTPPDKEAWGGYYPVTVSADRGVVYHDPSVTASPPSMPSPTRLDHPQHDHTGYVRGLERAVDALLEKAPTFDSDWQAPGMVAVPLRLLSDLRKARDAGR